MFTETSAKHLLSIFSPSLPATSSKVYHISRNLWFKMENRTVKNISAPAAVIDDKIYIVGGSGV